MSVEGQTFDMERFQQKLKTMTDEELAIAEALLESGLYERWLDDAGNSLHNNGAPQRPSNQAVEAHTRL
jgi:hypothetical protein